MSRRKLKRELEALERAGQGRAGGSGRPPPPTLGERLAKWARSVRHPIRAAAMGMAALALAWGVATGSGLLAAGLGAVAGVALGELLARTQSRLLALLAGTLVVGVAGWWLTGRITAWRLVPVLIGPGAALGLSSMLRFFLLALCSVGALRMMAARHRALVGLELAAVGASIAALFAGHREGVIARPLWLSDWAWEHGYDPAEILLTVGALAVVVLASLLIAESERRVTLASLAGLAGIVLLELAVLQVEGLPEPQANSDLGLTEAQVGDPPRPSDDKNGKDSAGADPDEGEGEGGGQDSGEDGGGQGQQPEQDEGEGGEDGGQGQQSQGQQGGEQQQGQQQQGEQQQGQRQQDQQGGGQNQQQQQPDLDQQPSEGSKPAPMAVVLLGDDYSPPLQAYYFRQDAWSHFNGSRLVAPNRPDVDRDIVRRFPARPIKVRETPPSAFHTEVHAEIVLLAKHAQPFALESAISMQPEPNPNPARFLRAYSTVSLAPDYELEELIGREPGDPAWTEAQREFYTRGPSDARFTELARELVDKLPEDRRDDPFMQALSIKLWMDEELVYSSAERHAGVPDPTADFLFGNKIGYCVHFAHAAVYMWRSLGIPARVGVGYHVSEDQRRGSTLVIRGGDAHAWPELYLEGIGWVVLDIAARENLDPPGEPMDDDLSELLGEMARNEGRDDEGEGERKPVQRRNFGRDIGFGFLFTLLVGLVGLYVLKIWRRLAPRFASREQLPRVAYRTVVDILTDAGLSRRYGETREGFARRVSAEVPSLAGITSMHVAAAFGDPRVPAAARPEFDPAVWERGLASVRGELPHSVPRWRRVLGGLDPSTVLRGR